MNPIGGTSYSNTIRPCYDNPSTEGKMGSTNSYHHFSNIQHDNHYAHQSNFASQHHPKNHQKAFEYYTEEIENPVCAGVFQSKLYYYLYSTLYYVKTYTECVNDINKALKIDDEYVKKTTNNKSEYFL